MWSRFHFEIDAWPLFSLVASAAVVAWVLGVFHLPVNYWERFVIAAIIREFSADAVHRGTYTALKRLQAEVDK